MLKRDDADLLKFGFRRTVSTWICFGGARTHSISTIRDSWPVSYSTGLLLAPDYGSDNPAIPQRLAVLDSSTEKLTTRRMATLPCKLPRLRDGSSSVHHNSKKTLYTYVQ